LTSEIADCAQKVTSGSLLSTAEMNVDENWKSAVANLGVSASGNSGQELYDRFIYRIFPVRLNIGNIKILNILSWRLEGEDEGFLIVLFSFSNANEARLVFDKMNNEIKMEGSKESIYVNNNAVLLFLGVDDGNEREAMRKIASCLNLD
jgi:hypothetical protein